MNRTRIPAVAAVMSVALMVSAALGCGTSPPSEVGCNIQNGPEIADEALACASRGVDGGNGVTYWLLPLTPVVVAETGVIHYVLVAANTSEAPTSSLLSMASGNWLFEPDDGEPIKIKAITPSVGPAVEAGPGDITYYVGSLGIWGAGVPALAGGSWVNLRLELADADRTVSLRLRLPVRTERREGLDADCWRAVTMHRDRPLRNWANDLPNALLREEARD